MSGQQRPRIAQATDIGRVRDHNEDAFGHIRPEDLRDGPARYPIDAMAVVADGMGGQAAGEVASDITIKSVTLVMILERNDALVDIQCLANMFYPSLPHPLPIFFIFN